MCVCSYVASYLSAMQGDDPTYYRVAGAWCVRAWCNATCVHSGAGVCVRDPSTFAHVCVCAAYESRCVCVCACVCRRCPCATACTTLRTTLVRARILWYLYPLDSVSVCVIRPCSCPFCCVLIAALGFGQKTGINTTGACSSLAPTCACLTHCIRGGRTVGCTGTTFPQRSLPRTRRRRFSLPSRRVCSKATPQASCARACTSECVCMCDVDVCPA